MPLVFSVKLPDELAVRLDQMAAVEGGRATVVRRLPEQAVGMEGYVPPRRRPRDVRTGDGKVATIGLELSEPELADLSEQAAESGMSKGQWLHACVRHRLSGRRQFNPADRLRLLNILRELRAMTSILDRMSRARGSAAATEIQTRVQAATLKSIEDRLAGLSQALQAAFSGNDSYWSAAREAASEGDLEPSTVEREMEA